MAPFRRSLDAATLRPAQDDGIVGTGALDTREVCVCAGYSPAGGESFAMDAASSARDFTPALR